MIFTMSKGTLANALGTVSKYAGQSEAYLACVHIEAKGDRVTLSATNLNESARCADMALVEEDGECLISAKRLNEIVKTLPDQAVTIEAYDDRAAIRCGKANFAIPAMDPADFPGTITFNAENGVRIDSATFAMMVGKCARFAAKDDSHPILKGILIEADGSTLRMVATDSYSLICCETGCGSEFSVVVPATFASAAASVKASSRDVSISYDGSFVMIEDGGVTLATRRLEGNFPAWQRLMPEGVESSAEFDRGEIAGAVKRASTVGRNVPVSISFNDGTARIEASSKDEGNMSEEVGCKSRGECFIKVNAAYASDALNAFAFEHVTLGFNGATKPLLMTEHGTRAIVMPVR